MEFLQERPKVSLAAHPGSKHTTFAADLSTGRSPFQEILLFRDRLASLHMSMQELIARATCPLSSISIFLDKTGTWLIATAKTRMPVGNARQAVDLVVKQLPEPQRFAIEASFRAFDELDMTRVDDWEPAWLPEEPPAEMSPFLDSYEIAPRSVTEISTIDYEHWKEHMQCYVTIVLARVGTQILTYVRCHREHRRVALLAKDLSAKASLLDCVRKAVRLAKEGSLPGHEGPRARKTEFLKRCSSALAIVNPAADGNVQKLEQSRELTQILAPKSCHICGQGPAAPPNAELLAWWGASPEVGCGKLYCVEHTASFCPKCDKDDALDLRVPSDFERCYGLASLHCDRCNCRAIAPPTKKLRLGY